MILAVRKILMWATAVAAIVGAVTLASNDGGLPRIDAAAASNSVTSAAPVH